MLAGVKSQMSGWLSGGIPGLNRGGSTAEGEVVPAETTETQTTNPAQPGETVKDDDASRWFKNHQNTVLVTETMFVKQN